MGGPKFLAPDPQEGQECYLNTEGFIGFKLTGSYTVPIPKPILPFWPFKLDIQVKYGPREAKYFADEYWPDWPFREQYKCFAKLLERNQINTYVPDVRRVLLITLQHKTVDDMVR